LSATPLRLRSGQAEAIGDLQATEILSIDEPPITVTVVARSGKSGSIVVIPSGNGRVVVTGAMDAWRYRELDAGGFDRFWRSLIAEGASQGAALQLTFDRDVAALGSRARFTLRDHRMVPSAASEASAIADAEQAACLSEVERASAIRLWPAGAIGEFTGELSLPSIGSCEVEASVGDHLVTRSIAVAARPAPGVERTLTQLERRVKASGGVVVRADDEATLARSIAASSSSSPVVANVRPMRSAWWIIPFAGCLSVEWWLRRRAGLR
jgi:hypothetical protein